MNNTEPNESVPTDLTVSVGGLSTVEDLSVNDDAEKLREVIKSLRNENELQKLQLNQKSILLAKLQIELQVSRDSQNDKLDFLTRDNERLRKQHEESSSNANQLLLQQLRLESEKTVLEKQVKDLSEKLQQLHRELSEAREKYNAVTGSIARGELTAENYARLEKNAEDLQEQLKMQNTKLSEALQQQEAWKKRYEKLRFSYDKQMRAEIEKLRESLHNQVSVLKAYEAGHLEHSYEVLVEENSRLISQLKSCKSENEALRRSLREASESTTKWKKLHDSLQTSQTELMQRLAAVSVIKIRLEGQIKEMAEDVERQWDDNLTQLRSKEDQVRQLEMQLENHIAVARDYENTFFALAQNLDEEVLSRLPVVLKTQITQSSRSLEQIAKLEAENNLLKRQCIQLNDKLDVLEAEVDQRNQLLNGRAPDYVSIIRAKEAQIRQLRSLCNKQEIKILELSKQVEQLKILRNQLRNDLDKLLRNRKEMDALRRICQEKLS